MKTSWFFRNTNEWRLKWNDNMTIMKLMRAEMENSYKYSNNEYKIESRNDDEMSLEKRAR